MPEAGGFRPHPGWLALQMRNRYVHGDRMVEVKINGKKRQYNFRVESFRWEPDDEIWEVEKKIKMLQSGLEGYDKSWELIQIFRPKENSKFIQVLYRQRQPVASLSGESTAVGK